MDRLTHLDAAGQARMVDVGDKEITRRRARAGATVSMSPATCAAIVAGDAPKGDVIGTARIAGIQAAKRTSELIPLAHPIALDLIDILIEVDPEAGEARIEAVAAVSERTGVEMEVMTACAVAALTLYDMVKGIERGVEIRQVVLLEKSGGKAPWQRDSDA